MSQKTRLGARAFVEELPRRFASATQGEARTAVYRVGGRPLRIDSSDAAIEELVRRAFGHLASAEEPVARLRVWAGSREDRRVAPPALRHEDIGPLGEVRPLQEEGLFALFTAPGLLSVYDPGDREAFHWITSLDSLPVWETAAPMRSLLGAVLRDRGSHIVHGAAVSVRGRGALIVGDSGAGKTSTALACLEAGHGLLGDDYVALTLEDGRPQVHALFGSVKAYPDDMARAAQSAGVEALRSPGEPKAIAFIANTARAVFPRSAPLHALLVPRITEEAFSHPIQLPGARAALPVLASTASHTSGSGVGLLRLLGAIAKSTPAFDLPLSPDRAENPRRIERLMEAVP